MKIRYNEFINTLCQNESSLAFNLYKKIKKAGYTNIEESFGRYIYAEGNIPVLITAHLDTVLPSPTRELIFYDKRRKVLWSPTGIGGDDRCGVFAIMEIINMGFMPHILFTHGEESGGTGAKAFIKDYPSLSVNYIIEMDRHGSNHAVFYDCANESFIKYALSFGFVEKFGTFSDICILSPAYDVASVNFSVGFANEHSKHEHISIISLEATISKVINMLEKTTADKYTYDMIIYNYKYSKQDVDGRNYWEDEYKGYYESDYEKSSRASYTYVYDEGGRELVGRKLEKVAVENTLDKQQNQVKKYNAGGAIDRVKYYDNDDVDNPNDNTRYLNTGTKKTY